MAFFFSCRSGSLLVPSLMERVQGPFNREGTRMSMEFNTRLGFGVGSGREIPASICFYVYLKNFNIKYKFSIFNFYFFSQKTPNTISLTYTCCHSPQSQITSISSHHSFSIYLCFWLCVHHLHLLRHSLSRTPSPSSSLF